MTGLPAAAVGATPASQQRLPDFIGIGAIKSGTTWLWACLREHPQIFLPAMKELEFFDRRYDLGLEWYCSFFAPAGGRLCGEISPQYLHDPAAVARMRFLAGRCRLLVSLRNPVERAFSHFQMDAREWSDVSGEEKLRRFAALVAERRSKYLEFGLYARQLRPYLEAFGREHVHVVLFDDIRTRPAGVISDVLRFLGVAADFVPTRLVEPVNTAKRYRSARLFGFLRHGVHLAERAGLGSLILWLKRTTVRDRVIALLEVEQPYDGLPPALRQQLAEFYAGPNAELGQLIGRDLGAWGGS